MSKSLKINKISLISFVFAISLEIPAYITQLVYIYRCLLVIRILGYCLILFAVLARNLRHNKLTLISVAIIIFCGVLTISTILNGRSFSDVVLYCVPIMLGVFYFDSLERDEFVYALRGISVYLSIITYINFCSVLLFPDGLYSGLHGKYEAYYFLGHNNSAVRIIFPAIVFSALYDIFAHKKIRLRTWILMLVSFVTVTITWSNSSMIGLGIWILYAIVFARANKVNRINSTFQKLNGSVLFFVPIILFMILIVLNNISIFEYIIVNIFHKSADLTGRSTIWNAALLYISRQPMLGYGNGVYLTDLTSLNSTTESCHNFFLDLLLRGGVALLTVQLVINWICCNKLKRRKGILSMLLSAALLSYFVMWQVGAFVNMGITFMYMIFVLCYKINTLEITELSDK